MDKIFSLNKTKIIVIVFTMFFGFVSWSSLSSIWQLHGNARVINYVGIVRGATQRLVKKELQSYPDDGLVARLNSIVDELITGEGPNGLVVLDDRVYLDNMNQVQRQWADLKTEIDNVREGGDDRALYEKSEEYFNLVDRTVSSAEAFTERQVRRSTQILLGANLIFVLILIAGITYYVRTMTLKRKAEQLSRLAYYDPMTHLPNRASCEREIHSLNSETAPDDVAVFMFDMNNLKRANDQLGHKGGDKLIADFARILGEAAEPFGFAGRYGGDEFVAVFRNVDESTPDRFLGLVNEKVVAYNILLIDEIEKLSFAAGYCIGNLKDTDMTSLLNEADRLMYVRKRQMKENRD